MSQGLSQISRNVARHAPSAKDFAHARTLRAQHPFDRGGAECKGLSDYRKASGLWAVGADGPLSGCWGRDFGFLTAVVYVEYDERGIELGKRHFFVLVRVKGGWEGNRFISR